MGLLVQLSLVTVPLMVIIGIATVMLPPDGITLKFGVGFGGLALSWLVLSVSAVIAAPSSHDRAFSIGRKSLAFQFAMPAIFISTLALTPIPGWVVLSLHAVNAVLFFVLATLASSAAPVVAEMGTARLSARRSADSARTEAAVLRATVEAAVDPAGGQLISLARSIQDAVDNMGTRAGVDLTTHDEDIAAMIRAVRRSFSASARVDEEAGREQLQHCEKMLHQMLEAREIDLKAYRT